LKFERFIASRYLNFRKRGFISLITAISVLGVFLGTCVLTIAMAISNGMENEVRDRITGTFAHARIQKYSSAPIENYEEIAEMVSAYDGVVAVSPTIMGKGAVESSSIQEGVMIVSVNDFDEVRVSDVHKRIIEGEFSLKPKFSIRMRELPAMVVGRGLANKFALSTGDELVLMTLATDEQGDPSPSMDRFVISGIFSTGMYEYDQNLIFISLEAGQKLFEINGVEMISFRAKNIYKAGSIASEIVAKLGYP